MNEGQMKVITEGIVESAKLGAVNALTYIQKSLEAYKTLKLPIISGDGQYYYGERIPYEQDKQVQTFVDFMLVCLNEVLKKYDKENEAKKNE